MSLSQKVSNGCVITFGKNSASVVQNSDGLIIVNRVGILYLFSESQNKCYAAHEFDAFL